jgi:DNA-binding NarL/FixJ family response regulator
LEQRQKPMPTESTKLNHFLLLSNDKQVKFYTGLPSKAHFDLLCEYIEPKMSKARYWHGPKKAVVHVKNRSSMLSTFSSPAKTGRKRKLTFREEMLLVLMKLRLGLTNHDIGNRFNISDSMVSSIFTTLIKVLSNCLRPSHLLPGQGCSAC